MTANVQRMTVWGMPRLRNGMGGGGFGGGKLQDIFGDILAAWAAVVVAARAASSLFWRHFWGRNGGGRSRRGW